MGRSSNGHCSPCRFVHQVSAGNRTKECFDSQSPASVWPVDSGQGLVARYDIEEFLVNGLLAYAMQL